MNRILILPAGLVLFTLWGAFAQSGGSFAIVSFTVDSGGGRSSGGTFALAGTAGQPDAGKHSGAGFSLSGGFWQVFVVPGPGAPELSIRLSPGPRVVLAWPVTSEVWQLEYSNDMQHWTPVPDVPAEDAGQWSVTVQAGAARLFFRLTAVP